jgi:2-oxo-3-hexenedioate decarboxylase
VLSAAEDVVRPFIPRLPWMDRASITQGYAGVYSSFLLHAERAAERYDVPAHEILQKVGEYGYVGGQEDMIIDIALELAEERRDLVEGDLAGMGWRCVHGIRLRAAPEGGWDIESVAAELLRCEDERREREPFTDEWPELDLDTGYAIQDLNLAKRLERGEKLIGVKLGLTSRAKQQRMGVHFPFVAWLTDAMILPVGDPVPQGKLIHPRIEPEIVFVMGERLEGPGVTCAQAMSAVESVWGGAEVIDSRYKNFRFTAGDVAADNASSGAFVTGPIGLPRASSTSRSRRCSSRSTVSIVDSATGAAVQGHPGEALALAANDLARRGHAIEAGLDRAHRRHDGCRVRTARVVIDRCTSPTSVRSSSTVGRAERHAAHRGDPGRGPHAQQLRTLISALTHAAAEAVDAPVDSIRVVSARYP